MKTLVQRLLRRLLKYFQESDTLGAVLLAVTIGLVGGTGAILFRYLIYGVRRLFFEGFGHGLPFLGDYYVILLPAAGLMIVSWIVRKWAPEAQGHGVPEVMYAVRKQGGRIRPRVAVVKALASALCIGSGGSVGREGPIVQIGCTFGSTMGQILGLNEDRVRLLLAAGGAAGVAGTFNAPIAGVLFALEVLLGNFTGRAFGLVVISSVTSTALCQSFLGDHPAFALEQPFSLVSPAELPLYAALGLSAGLIALAFVRTLYFFEDLFERWTWPPLVKSLAGGLAVGAMGCFGSRYLFGVGYEGIEAALDARLAIGTLVLVLLLKILATSVTLGAGGSGGVFAPSLFIGAMAGGAFGHVANHFFPDITAAPGAYALVGMAAVFAGAAHAPITSIVILFEMTDDYKIILPLMIAVVLSYLAASRLDPDNVYTIKLRRRGGMRPKKTDFSVLDVILVTDAMSTDYRTVRPDIPVSELASELRQGRERSFPVVGPGNELVGILTQRDVENALLGGNAGGLTAADIMTRAVITCTPNQGIGEALRILTTRDFGLLPVVDGPDSRKLAGVLRRREILWAYGEMAQEHQKLVERVRIDLPAHQKDSVQIEVPVRQEHRALCSHQIREIELPDNCLIVLLRRADRAIIPRGKTVVEAGDSLVFLTTRSNEARLREWVDRLGGAGSA